MIKKYNSTNRYLFPMIETTATSAARDATVKIMIILLASSLLAL